MQDSNVRKYNKIIFAPRPDGGSVKSKIATNETTLNQINPHFHYNIVEIAEAVNLIKSLELIDPNELFDAQMASQKPKNLFSKRLQLAQKSKTIIQLLDCKQKAALKTVLKAKVKSGKVVTLGNSKGPLFESDNFALPKPPGIEEPLWVTSRR